MRLSKKTEYALRALIYSARFPEGTTFQIRELAEKNGIPKKFLELILLDLKNAGILSSRRGVGGGYLLARHPETIRTVEIVEVFEGPIVPMEPKKDSGKTFVKRHLRRWHGWSPRRPGQRPRCFRAGLWATSYERWPRRRKEGGAT